MRKKTDLQTLVINALLLVEPLAKKCGQQCDPSKSSPIAILITKMYPNKSLQGNKSTYLVAKSLKLIHRTVLTDAAKEMRPLVASFAVRWPGFGLRSSHVEFVVAKVTLGQVFSEYFGCPCQFAFHRLLHTHHLSSGTGTVDQILACVPIDTVSPQPRQKQIAKKYSLSTKSLRGFEKLWRVNKLSEPHAVCGRSS
jgi:hypothetical protein